jgi:ubiquinone/menaquinone biosynthesis C-methylase UbiE
MDGDQTRWTAKQAHYQDPRVVAEYDAHRFRGRHQRGSTARKWRRIQSLVGGDLSSARAVLDLPCGNGRFTRELLDAGAPLVNADLSRAMLGAAARVAGAAPRGFRGSVQCDVAHLPFRDDAFDIVLSIRFLFHVPRALRPALLAEMARVSRRWLVIDVRHKYCVTTHTKRLRAWLSRKRPPSPRYSLREIDADLAAAGLVLRRRVWLAPLFSEKMLLLCEKSRG